MYTFDIIIYIYISIYALYIYALIIYLYIVILGCCVGVPAVHTRPKSQRRLRQRERWLLRRVGTLGMHPT